MLLSADRDHPRRPEELLDSRVMARLDRLDLASKRVFAGKLVGERRSKKRGQSVEFDDYRTYTAGDDLRFIDWNVYARFDRLFIKLFLEEEDLALHIALDASASMDTGTPNKLVFGARVAAALAYIGLVKNNRVSATVFGVPGSSAPVRIDDTRGRHQMARFGRSLLDAAWPDSRSPGPAAPASAFNEALTTTARLRVGKGVLVVLSDFLDPAGYERGLRSLAAAGGYDIFCAQVLSPGEIDPEREAERGLSGDLRMTDIESGRAAEITLSAPLIRKYKERLQSFCADLSSFCAARQMTHIMLRSDADLETVLLDTFRRRGVVA